MTMSPRKGQTFQVENRKKALQLVGPLEAPIYQGKVRSGGGGGGGGGHDLVLMFKK